MKEFPLTGPTSMDLQGGSLKAQDHVYGHTTTLGAETATEVLSVTMTDGDYASIEIKGCIRADDGADASVETFTVQIGLIDRAGGVTASTPGVISTIVNTGASVLTAGVWTVTQTDDLSIEINVASVVSGITQTTHEVEWTVSRTSNIKVTTP